MEAMKMNKVGIHYCYWSRSWNTDFFESIRHAASVGFDEIDLNSKDIMSMPLIKQEELRRVAEDLGIMLVFSPDASPYYDLASPDKTIRERGIEHYKRNIVFASSMGSEILGGVIYSQWRPDINAEIAKNKADYLERSAESLQKVLPTAENYGIKYCIEAVNRFEQYMINSAAEAVAFVDMLGSPAAKILLDTFHMNIEEDNIADAIHLAGNRLAHFHVGEGNRRVPKKDSRMPWKEIFNALKDIHYQGAIVMEPFVKMGGDVGFAVGVWRDIVSGGDDILDADAMESIAFVKEMLRG